MNSGSQEIVVINAHLGGKWYKRTRAANIYYTARKKKMQARTVEM